jgi:hypothetical protein
MQSALSPLPDWKSDVLQVLLDKLDLKGLSSLGDAYPVSQPEERKSVIFETPSHGADGTENEHLSTDYHRG